MTHDVNLGIGLASGMAYHAPAGTALPAYPGEELSEAWVEIGAVAEDGITWGTNQDRTPLRNWAKEIERMMAADGDSTVEVPFIYTTAETLTTLFGTGAVTVSEHDAEHGDLVSVEVGPESMPGGEAFLFLMKDDDDLMMLGTTKGFVTSVSDVDFAPNSAITWTGTISAKYWTFMKEAFLTRDGQRGADDEEEDPNL